uniref:UBX domain protein 1 n=1 Tax=Taeniopygia guttata TaxID=59729 RepID=A0A674H5J8_TAEGU
MAAGGGAEPGRALEALLEMGFGARAKALALTGNRGVEQAMDWVGFGLFLVSFFGYFWEGFGVGFRVFLEYSGCFWGPRLLSEAGQERERRRRGQELAKLREWRRDEERRRAAEERRRERAEEWAARYILDDFRFCFSPAAPARLGLLLGGFRVLLGDFSYILDGFSPQLRMPDGRALTQSFRAQEPLAAVRLFVELQGGPGGLGGSGGPPEPFSLRTAFPRRLFTEDDMEKPLQELGLVPSAVVIVAKKEGS